jgi:hypothetical protein
MTHIVYGKFFSIGRHCWKTAREISSLTGESCFPLFVQDVRRRRPLPNDGLPRLNQLLARWVTHVLAVIEIHNDRFHTLKYDAGSATALRTEEFVGVLALGLSTEEPTCGVGGDSLVAHQLSEVLPPDLQHGFVDVQSFAEFVLGLHDQVHVRVLLIGMQDHRVSMRWKVDLREGSCSREDFVRTRGVGHR